MKNALLMMFVAVCALVTLDSAVMAGGPSSGGGKSSSRARVVFDSSASQDVRVWVRAVGTPLPPTVAELNALLISVPAGRQNIRTSRLANGDYTVTTVLAENVDALIDEDLTAELFAEGSEDEITITLDGEDLDFTIEDFGVLEAQ